MEIKKISDERLEITEEFITLVDKNSLLERKAALEIELQKTNSLLSNFN